MLPIWYAPTTQRRKAERPSPISALPSSPPRSSLWNYVLAKHEQQRKGQGREESALRTPVL